MTNAIKSIHKWQVDSGNTKYDYDDHLESSFQVEEALEPFDVTNLASTLDCQATHKDVSRAILDVVLDTQSTMYPIQVRDVDRLDKALDAIIFAIGSMAKLGLNPQDINKALLIVNHANMQKLGFKRDEHGKLLKPADFKGPEPELQKLLDKLEV